MTDREALERIAALAIEEGDYDYEPLIQALPIALEALGWVYWRCESRFTGCQAHAVGPRDDLRGAGWKMRGDRTRCPKRPPRDSVQSRVDPPSLRSRTAIRAATRLGLDVPPKRRRTRGSR